MDSETQKWLDRKLDAYRSNPNDALEEMLSDTTECIEQFLNSESSLAAKAVLQSCMKHNKLFLENLGWDVDMDSQD